MIISITDDEYVIISTAVLVYSYVLNGNIDLELDRNVDAEALMDMNRKVIKIMDGDFAPVEKVLKKLSMIGEINANFPNKSELC